MRISTVIPTRNRAALLSQTLRYLSAQELPDGLEMEVIVVDDGSTDDTRDVVDAWRRDIGRLVYVHHARSERARSCVSRVRNLGIQRSSGEVVNLIDCGVLVPPCFMRIVADGYAGDRDAVLLHYTVGLFAEPDSEGVAALADLVPDTLLDVCTRLRTHPDWIDLREVYLEALADDPRLVPAPWALGWSCALSVPARLIQRVGGFDEVFHDWGCEDIEFSYRLRQHGASFASPSGCMVLHVPHARASLDEVLRSHRRNSEMFHRKHYQLESELFLLYESPYVNQVLARFEHLVLSDFVLSYAPRLLHHIDETFVRGASRSLLIGFDSPAMIQALGATHVWVWNQSLLRRLRARFKDRDIACLLGVDTPYEDRFFDVIVLSDFVRMLGPMVWQALIREACRIARRVVLVCTENEHVARAQRIDGWPWATIAELHAAAAPGLVMCEADRLDEQRLITIHSRALPGQGS